MKSIIEEMFYGNISGFDIKAPRKDFDAEHKQYEKLKGALSKEDMLAVDSFIEIMSDRVSKEHCDIYKLGFKTGFMLGIELSEKEDL